MGVMLKMKNKKLKVFVGFVVVIGIFGIIELVVYGVMFRLKKFFVCGVISVVVGGVIIG